MANEIRVRVDFVAGVLSAGMLTGDTLMQGVGLADLPVIGSPQHAALSLFRADSTGRVIQKEIVWVTAHADGAPTATVTRGREGTTAQTWDTGDRFSLTSVSSDLLTICTSASRPPSPYHGQVIYQTDNDEMWVRRAAGWDAPKFGGILDVQNARIGDDLYYGSVYASFRYKSHVANTDYGLMLQQNGATYLNCPSGQTLRLRIANIDKAIIDASGVDGTGGRVKSVEGHFGTLRNHAANGACTIICINNGNGFRPQWDGTLKFYIESSNVKNFVIPHPTDEKRWLIHACVEEPEATVAYRGQSQLANGWVEVKLPSYFEALCAEEGRTVMLTCIADDPADEWCPVLHATYPKKGRFFVGLGSGMAIPDQRFWWQVTGVRKDVPAVRVEPLRSEVEVVGEGPYRYYREAS